MLFLQTVRTIIFSQKKSHLLIFLILFSSLGLALFLNFVPHKALSQELSEVKPTITASVKISLLNSKPISKYIWGTSTSSYSSNFANPTNFFTQYPEEKVKELGVTLIRLPGGCPADGFNWRAKEIQMKSSVVAPTLTWPHMGIGQMLQVTERVNADLLFVLNTETKGLSNPCGDVPAYKGTIQDAKDIVAALGTRIAFYELGNEPWGSWNPVEYANTAVLFARAMKSVNPAIKIGIVGHPTTGNNMNLSQDMSARDAQWTNEVKRVLKEKCGTVDCFDFVTDHPYTNAIYNQPKNPSVTPRAINFKGKAVYYAVSEYPKIFNKRVADYAPKKVAITEWNVVCWTTPPVGTVGSVEQGLFHFETKMAMIKSGVFMANSHDIGHSQVCGLMSSRDAFTPAGKVASFAKSISRGRFLSATYTEPPTKFTIPLDQNCTSVGCLRGGNKVPYVGVYANRGPQGEFVNIFIINRHGSQPAEVKLDLSEFIGKYDLQPDRATLQANDYTDQTFEEETSSDNSLVASYEANSGKISLTVDKISVTRLQLKRKVTVTHEPNSLMEEEDILE